MLSTVGEGNNWRTRGTSFKKGCIFFFSKCCAEDLIQANVKRVM